MPFPEINLSVVFVSTGNRLTHAEHGTYAFAIERAGEVRGRATAKIWQTEGGAPR